MWWGHSNPTKKIEYYALLFSGEAKYNETFSKPNIDNFKKFNIFISFITKESTYQE